MREIATNRPHDQELAVLALQLLQNSLVYVNPLVLQAVVGAGNWLETLTPEDLRGLTPLIYAHVNPYRSFHLDMARGCCHRASHGAGRVGEARFPV